jgi:hypothetical protein
LRRKRKPRKSQGWRFPGESGGRCWKYQGERHFELHMKVKWLSSKKVWTTSKNILNPEKQHLKLAIMPFRLRKPGQFKVICT